MNRCTYHPTGDHCVGNKLVSCLNGNETQVVICNFVCILNQCAAADVPSVLVSTDASIVIVIVSCFCVIGLGALLVYAWCNGRRAPQDTQRPAPQPAAGRIADEPPPPLREVSMEPPQN